MTKTGQKDNTTFDYKVMIRKELLSMLAIDRHCIMETHGGTGQIYLQCYRDIETGVVFETDESKVDILARQRQTWRVYQANCISSIRAGVAADLPVTFLDVNPYGSCWDSLASFFESNRNFAPVMGIAVNDGMRQNLRIGAWDVHVLQDKVQKYGNKIHDIYLQVCRELLEDYSDIAGYTVDYFSGYYTGHGEQMTHFLAVLKQG